MTFSTPMTCVVGIFDSAAGFHHIALASSVNAAPAANALPMLLPLCSFNWNPVPNAWLAPSMRARPPMAVAIRVRGKGVFMTEISLRWPCVTSSSNAEARRILVGSLP